MPDDTKIKQAHLCRRAIVYIRQSSPKQVKHHQESQRLQYALRGNALELGWTEVEVTDCDLGVSATSGQKRAGFERMVAAVALGEVGIIFSREASRLSRTDKDWARLFEVCRFFDTLIGDGEQVYDCNREDDQLVLGIKAVLSVAEVRTIRKRLVEGMENKAKRGEFRRPLPAGYIWGLSGKVVKDPDVRVQDAIDLVFRKFREMQSIRQTHLWFHDQRIELPVNIHGSTSGSRVKWQFPKTGYLQRLLKNPCYAGVYVWGRDVTRPEYIDGAVIKRRTRRTDVWGAKVVLKGHHPGYISLEEFEQNQILIGRNCLRQIQNGQVGAAREGKALLGGILRCGHCGRKLHVMYYGKSGSAGRYVCRGDYGNGGDYCIAFGGSTVDKRFSAAFIEVISPLGVEASLHAANAIGDQSQEKARALAHKLAQLEYEVKRASEQYNSVDPRNRLVASELERRWNEALEAMEAARAALAECEAEPGDIGEGERARLLALGSDFARVWEHHECGSALRKKVIRTVVEEVVVTLDRERQVLRLVIHWKGGCHTALEMPKPVTGEGRRTDEGDLDIIRKMAPSYSDSDIARVLNRMGRKTVTGLRWNECRVQSTRGNYRIEGHTTSVEDPEVLTLGQTARFLGVSETTIKKLVASGEIEKAQVVPWAPWEIKKADLSSERIGRIIDHLHRTGKLVLGDNLSLQRTLFEES